MIHMRTLASHLFLPHQSNNQRPKVLHSQAVMVYVVIFFILQMGFRVGRFIYPNILGFATNITIERLLALTNQKRQENGLASFDFNPTLSAAASAKAQDMFADNYWAHVAPDGVTPWQFIEGSGYAYFYAGENLAKDFADSDGVVSAWMASPTHRDNILKKEYEDIGFAVLNGTLNGEETTLVVQMFGKRMVSVQKPALVPLQAAVAQTPVNISPSPALIPTSFVTPAPTLAKIPPVVSSSSLEAAVVNKKPLIDVLNLERRLSLGLIMVLLSVLVVDGVFVLKRKTVRVVGHNIAHIIFLATLIGLVFLTKKGVIL